MHAVAIVARTAVWHEVTIFVEIAVKVASRSHGRGRSGDWGYVGDITVVADGAAHSFLEDRATAFYLQDTLSHDTGSVVPDAVAQVARFAWVRRNLEQETIAESEKSGKRKK